MFTFLFLLHWFDEFFEGIWAFILEMLAGLFFFCFLSPSWNESKKMPKIQIKILIEYRIDISLAYIILISKSFGIVKILDLSQKCWKIMPRFFRQIISTFQRQINNYF